MQDVPLPIATKSAFVNAIATDAPPIAPSQLPVRKRRIKLFSSSNNRSKRKRQRLHSPKPSPNPSLQIAQSIGAPLSVAARTELAQPPPPPSTTAATAPPPPQSNIINMTAPSAAPSIHETFSNLRCDLRDVLSASPEKYNKVLFEGKIVENDYKNVDDNDSGSGGESNVDADIDTDDEEGSNEVLVASDALWKDLDFEEKILTDGKTWDKEEIDKCIGAVAYALHKNNMKNFSTAGTADWWKEIGKKYNTNRKGNRIKNKWKKSVKNGKDEHGHSIISRLNTLIDEKRCRKSTTTS